METASALENGVAAWLRSRRLEQLRRAYTGSDYAGAVKRMASPYATMTLVDDGAMPMSWHFPQHALPEDLHQTLLLRPALITWAVQRHASDETLPYDKLQRTQRARTFPPRSAAEAHVREDEASAVMRAVRREWLARSLLTRQASIKPGIPHEELYAHTIRFLFKSPEEYSAHLDDAEHLFTWAAPNMLEHYVHANRVRRMHPEKFLNRKEDYSRLLPALRAAARFERAQRETEIAHLYP